ncbi:MAG: tRNA lysidine(34) synthetase TilS [Paracoccus sp. (in: a-proteobacteria)]|nr:tRNA lysidine(34) synthetase TilS [Paracoccus sp. (in: a-proteobacteria)]
MRGDLQARANAALDRLCGDLNRIGIALSGGGDSVALLHLTASWAGGRRLMAASVDHGLRPESAAEAARAGEMARGLGLPHDVLTWDRGADQAGNLMANARDARRGLLGAWARENALEAVLLGHTEDDLAETLLMRLSRGAGLEGLAGMEEGIRAEGTLFLRPLLALGRAELRAWLTAQGAVWADDPSNDDPRFERARTRRAIAALGLPASALALSASHLRAASAALGEIAQRAAQGATFYAGALRIDRHAFADSPAEIRRRILLAGARTITGQPYAPRRSQTSHALEKVDQGRRATLDGAVIERRGDWLQFAREPRAAFAANIAHEESTIWDNRWEISGLAHGDEVTALGFEALAGLDWRGADLSRDQAASLPALRRGGHLIAAPHLLNSAAARFAPLRNAADFHDLLGQH